MSRRWETVAVNRGLNLRVRESLEEALLWLGLFPSLLTPQSLEDRRDEIQKGFLCGLLISGGVKSLARI
jgi:hypothetical protein